MPETYVMSWEDAAEYARGELARDERRRKEIAAQETAETRALNEDVKKMLNREFRETNMADKIIVYGAETVLTPTAVTKLKKWGVFL